MKNNDTALIASDPLAVGDAMILAVTHGETIVSVADGASTCRVAVAVAVAMATALMPEPLIAT